MLAVAALGGPISVVAILAIVGVFSGSENEAPDEGFGKLTHSKSAGSAAAWA